MQGILYAAAEGLPFVKSGGLADVIGSLPQKIDKRKYKVAVVLPLYKSILERFQEELKEIAYFKVKSGLINKDASLYACQRDGIDYYFIRQDYYFGRDNLYSYGDDGERFAFYSAAILEMIPHLPFTIDIIHSHDWHVGMVPVLCKEVYKNTKIKHVFTIHNLQFQGNYPLEMGQYFNLPFDIVSEGAVHFDNGISYMKAAISYADKVTTVSETYAKEILTPEYGERMSAFLKARESNLVGIVNGIDVVNWDPASDSCLEYHFSKRSLANKKKCKKKVQQRLGLRVADDVMLVGMISRLTWQKGAAIILEKMATIMGQDIQLIILGSGDNYIENQLRKIEEDYPHRAVFYCGYNEELSHEIYAGLDLFIMPSLFEPCGISQLISMRYGTLPLVRETGGLKDTVEPYDEYKKTGTGFSFKKFSGDDFIYMLKYAIMVYYYRKDDWKQLMKNAMSTDVSWDGSAVKYDKLYASLFDK